MADWLKIVLVFLVLAANNTLISVVWYRHGGRRWGSRIADAIAQIPVRHDGSFSERDPFAVRDKAAAIASGRKIDCRLCGEPMSRASAHICSPQEVRL